MTNREQWLKTTMTNEEREVKIIELAEKKYILNESLNLHEEAILNSSIKNVNKEVDLETRRASDEYIDEVNRQQNK
tara:strand:+ start:43 stop:270 length:228 start_codon:yes stop_codon:yes gene_type:complete